MKIKKFINRDKNLVNYKKDLKKIYSIKNFPVFMGITSQNLVKDKFFDMNFLISKSTGLVQLNPILPFNIIYYKGHNSGKIGKLWDEHHKSFAQYILKSKPKSVLEIGGGHGILSKNYQKKKRIKWTIIEPNPSPVANAKAKFVKKFFSARDISKFKADVILHSHVLEHIFDPLNFIKKISNQMNYKQLMIFSIPNIPEMIKRKYTNALNFEHTYYLDNSYLNYLIKSNNLMIIDKKKFKNDHSLFYTVKKISTKKKYSRTYKNNYDKNLKVFKKYFSEQKKTVKNINSQIKKNKPLFVFGAHIFTQFLLATGIDEKRIISVLDNDESKQNKRLYGSKLFVSSPKILAKYKKPCVILRAGVYSKEIKEDIIQNINKNTIFI